MYLSWSPSVVSSVPTRYDRPNLVPVISQLALGALFRTFVRFHKDQVAYCCCRDAGRCLALAGLVLPPSDQCGADTNYSFLAI